MGICFDLKFIGFSLMVVTYQSDEDCLNKKLFLTMYSCLLWVNLSYCTSPQRAWEIPCRYRKQRYYYSTFFLI